MTAAVKTAKLAGRRQFEVFCDRIAESLSHAETEQHA
jgi:hypothetical protein